MHQFLLSFLILVPLAATVVLLFLPSHFIRSIKWITIMTSVFQCLGLAAILWAYDTSVNTLQLVEKQSWIRLDLGSWGILKADYFLGVDGLGLPLVVLSVFVMLIATIASYHVEKNVKGYFILLLILNAAVIGTFTAQDFLLFYLFFEFMLLPMFFLIGIWGGPRREYASLKFFLYTLVGSIFILIAMIALYISVNEPSSSQNMVHSFSIETMSDPSNFISGSILDPHNSWEIGPLDARHWAFLLLFIGFAIKLPMVPFHTWLPDAHVEASTPISVILAALLLKIGGYGLLRIAFPVLPEAALFFSWTIGLLGVISIIYGALNALASKDLKRLIAYSSVSHMGFVLLGVSSVTSEGIAGAIYQMFSHGIISAMLFLLAGVLYDRTHDRIISNYSGLASKMPVYFVFILIGFFASLGLPGFSGFIAEIFVFLGAFKAPSTNGLLHEAFAVVATGGLVLGAAYYLWTIQRMFFGPFHFKGKMDGAVLTDVNRREYMLLLPLGIAALTFGIFPQLLLNVINPFTEAFVENVLTLGKSITIKP